MNKKGFTLIEITAVVLILGVIFLISYPTLENILKKSEKDQINLDNENIIMAAKTYINIHNDEYDFSEGNVLNISSSALIKDGLIDNANFNYLSCTYTNSNLECDITEYPVYKDSTAIYFDPDKANVCTEEEASVNVNENGTPTGINSGCMKWYVFNDSGSSNAVNLISDHNMVARVQYDADDGNQLQVALENTIENWDENIKNTSRMLTFEEVLDIIGQEGTSSLSNITLDLNYVSGEVNKFYWLYDYTYNCEKNGCKIKDSFLYDLNGENDYIFGYWLQNDELANSSIFTSAIFYSGRILYMSKSDVVYGLRPVITIDKSLIS